MVIELVKNKLLGYVGSLAKVRARNGTRGLVIKVSSTRRLGGWQNVIEGGAGE